MIFGESVLGKLAMTFFMAMVPVVELRGAIPLGVAAGLPPAVAAVTAMAGNLMPVPCILLLLRRVFALMRKSAWLGPKVDRLERRAHLKGRKVRKYRTLGLVLLVPALEPLFAVAPLSVGMVGAIVGLAFGSMLVIQLLKCIRR